MERERKLSRAEEKNSAEFFFFLVKFTVWKKGQIKQKSSQRDCRILVLGQRERNSKKMVMGNWTQRKYNKRVETAGD